MLLSLVGVMWGLLICRMRFGVIMTGVGVISLAGMAFAAWAAWRRRSLALTIVVIMWAAMWLPWARIDRATFQYHVYASLPFLIVALAYFLGELWHGPGWRTWFVARAAAALAAGLIGDANFTDDTVAGVTINAENLFSFDGTFRLSGADVKDGSHEIEIRRRGTGPVYFNLIRPFHHLVVSRMMKHGAAS